MRFTGWFSEMYREFQRDEKLVSMKCTENSDDMYRKVQWDVQIRLLRSTGRFNELYRYD